MQTTPTITIPQSAAVTKFVGEFMKRTAAPDQKSLRDEARKTILSQIKTAPPPSRDIQVVVFDMDHTKGLLYPISSSTGHWALSRIAQRNRLDAEVVFAAARKIEPEFLCHSPNDFMRQLAITTGNPKLRPDTAANEKIMADWRMASEELNKRLVFAGIKEGVNRIHNEGGLAYVATNAPPSNVFHRLHVWFGESAAKLFDGIAMRDSLKDMRANNPYASQAEKELTDKLLADGKVIIVPHAEIKPAGNHLNYVLEHATALRGQRGLPPVDPKKMALVGDSLSSDGGAAHNLRHFTGGTSAQFVYTAQGIVVDPVVLKQHAKVGAQRPDGSYYDVLGPGPVVDKIASGNYVRPNLALADFSKFFDAYKIESSGNNDNKPVILAGINIKTPGYVVNYKLGESDLSRHWGTWVTTQVGKLSDQEGGLAFCDKEIMVKPGKMLSIQKHDWRKEDWTVTSGVATVYLGNSPQELKAHTVKQGESIHIPAGVWHTVENKGRAPLVFSERQSGPYLDEGDNHRAPTKADPRTTDEAAISRIDLATRALGIRWPSGPTTPQTLPGQLSAQVNGLGLGGN